MLLSQTESLRSPYISLIRKNLCIEKQQRTDSYSTPPKSKKKCQKTSELQPAFCNLFTNNYSLA